MQKIPPVTVALTYKEQIVDNVPTEDTDMPINTVLFEA